MTVEPVAPAVGVKLEIDGSTTNASPVSVLPPALVTRIGPEIASAGTFVFSVVEPVALIAAPIVPTPPSAAASPN